MNDYVVVALQTIIPMVVLMIGVRWRFGDGLMTRLFRVVILSIAACAYLGFLLGKRGPTIDTFVIILTTATVVVIVMVYVIQKNVIDRVQAQADTVISIVRNLSATSSESAASAEEQAAAVTQVSSAVEEIHEMSRSTANTSQDVVKVAGQAVEQGHQGLESVREVLSLMERLAQAADFVDVVNQVAEQSNLLAFNAGIEAAKAEEFGRGFSVVAAEVRNLAEQSKQAAKQIRESIRDTEKGQKAIQVTDVVITELASVLQEASEKARQISGAAVQQSAGIKQISDAMTNLIQSGKHTAATSKQIKLAAEELDKVSVQLALIIHGDRIKKNALA